MKHFLLSLFIFSVVYSFAGNGDTTVILSHSNSNMASPPSNDDVWTVFPNNVSWSKIVMKFTLGCGTPNCSGWDYTVNTYFGKKTGIFDSTIVSIDTTLNDTTWNVFDVVKFYETGRLITPYGTYMANSSNGYNNQWKHVFYYDVTDYASWLKDSVNVRVHYDGWTDAFSAKVEFIMIEGTPSREVIQVDELYNTYIGYPNSAGFESVASPQTVNIPSSCTSAKLNLIMTGHGDVGEFEPQNISVDVNGTTVYSRLLWKEDCGWNAISPQGGTWIFNRANWCPGEKIERYEIDITPYIQRGQANTIDLNMDDFTVPGGSSAGYGTSFYCVSYGSNPLNDAALEEIIAPSNESSNIRFNPICSRPIVKIKNNGQNNLTQCDITYWVEGSTKCYYQWHGNLTPFQTATVTLPQFNWYNVDTTQKKFFAEVSWPNNAPDEYAANNLGYSFFDFVPRLDSIFIINITTNNHPEENNYMLRGEAGDTILFRNNLLPSALHRDTLNLSPGCYVFDLYDYDANWGGGDGLSWYLNTQKGWETSGSVLFRKLNGSSYKTFNPDFGSNLHYEFTVGYPAYQSYPKDPCTEYQHNTAIEEIKDFSFEIFPNPASSYLNIAVTLSISAIELSLLDINGQELMKQTTLLRAGNTNRLDLPENLANGVYFLQWNNGSRKGGKRFAVVK